LQKPEKFIPAPECGTVVRTSVILCTYNRSESLRKALGSLAVSGLPDSAEWEVLVIDNNSTDQTKEVADDFVRRYPGRFRYLFEPKPGKSYALNSGIRNARGEVLAFTDDDVTVDSAWLQNLTLPLCSGEWAGAGGRILPDWTCDPPSWFPENERYGMAPLVMFDFGLNPFPLTEAPFGANMAFHRRMFEKYGFFRTDLGPGLNRRVRNNEDSEFCRRLLGAGERLRYEPSALVHHYVPQERLQKEYFLTWWFNKARSDIRESRVPADTKWSIAGVPLLLFRRLVANSLRCVFSVKPSRRFAYRLAVWSLAGAIAESYCQSRDLKKRTEELTPA
jgi:glycosyltransferase involved in cell wall biosynthesis